MAAAIISIVFCSLVGFPVGIWALIVLTRADVRHAFGSEAPVAAMRTQTDHFWRRFAVVAGCVVLILIALAVLAAVALLFTSNLSQAEILPSQDNAGIYQEAGGEFHEDSSRTFPLNANGDFSLDQVSGRIEIHGWSSNAVLLHTAIHGRTAESVGAVKINIDSEPDKTRVHTEQPSSMTGFPWSWLWFKSDARNDASVDYTVQVPRGARLEGISSVNGRIVIDGVAGDITVHTVNGETQVKGAAGNLKLSTVNGRILADLASLGGGQSLSLDSVSGDMELALPDNADANFSVNTLNGSITSEFPSLKPETQFPGGDNLRGNLGNGSAPVRATAVSGSIKILKNRTP
jgi:hypothetical protein